jgi:hypothetical protein
MHTVPQKMKHAFGLGRGVDALSFFERGMTDFGTEFGSRGSCDQGPSLLGIHLD